MGAHLRPIVRKCNAPGCLGMAKQALYNTHNSHLGDYCTRHAKARLAEVRRDDRADGVAVTPKRAQRD